MSAIRPGLPLPTPLTGGETGRARQAQSAFFRTALDQAAPTTQARPTIAAAPTPAARLVVNTAQAAPEPTRILRPGSLLDIRI